MVTINQFEVLTLVVEKVVVDVGPEIKVEYGWVDWVDWRDGRGGRWEGAQEVSHNSISQGE